jgi:hypothetical protein
MSNSFRIEPITNGYLVHREKINIARQGMHETLAVLSTTELARLLREWLDYEPPEVR